MKQYINDSTHAVSGPVGGGRYQATAGARVIGTADTLEDALALCRADHDQLAATDREQYAAWRAEVRRLCGLTYWRSPYSRAEVTYNAVLAQACGLRLTGTGWASGAKCVYAEGATPPESFARAHPSRDEHLMSALERTATESTGYDPYS